jgi:chromosomal replication initiation ATPase DnaA
MLAAEMTPLSLPAIGRLFNRDHSTVMHAIGIMKVLCERDSAFSDEVEAVRKRVALEPA